MGSVRAISFLVVLTSLCATAVVANTMDALSGNTLIVSRPHGTTTKVFYDADKTYSRLEQGGSKFKGVWSLAGDVLCQTPTGGQKECFKIPLDKKAGDTWTQPGDGGAIDTISIKAGR